jgi:hypothetical protein
MSERKWRSSPIPQGSKRKLDHRQRIQALIVALRITPGTNRRLHLFATTQIACSFVPLAGRAAQRRAAARRG